MGEGACGRICTIDVPSTFPAFYERIGQLVLVLARVGPMGGLSPTSSGPGVCEVGALWCEP